jgi:hypothetical protein
MKRSLLFICSILGFSCSGGAPTEDLETRIETKLKDALTQFEPTNNAFLLTVYHNNSVIVQVVHRSYIEQTRQPNDEFGFAINITFDPTFTGETHNHKNFKNLAISKLFVDYEWDGIPCYALDLGADATKGAEVLTTILTDLYGFDNHSKLKIELLDQGRL